MIIYAHTSVIYVNNSLDDMSSCTGETDVRCSMQFMICDRDRLEVHSYTIAFAVIHSIEIQVVTKACRYVYNTTVILQSHPTLQTYRCILASWLINHWNCTLPYKMKVTPANALLFNTVYELMAYPTATQKVFLHYKCFLPQ